MRKSLDVRIDAEGRDSGKVFHIVEMPAEQGEKWAMRTLSAMVRSGVDIPTELGSTGMAGVAAAGIRAIAGIQWEMAEPLLDEMFQCVKIKPNPQDPSLIRELISQDIEEIATRFKLRKEALGLHLDFLKAVLPSTSDKASTARKGNK